MANYFDFIKKPIPNATANPSSAKAPPSGQPTGDKPADKQVANGQIINEKTTTVNKVSSVVNSQSSTVNPPSSANGQAKIDG